MCPPLPVFFCDAFPCQLTYRFLLREAEEIGSEIQCGLEMWGGEGEEEEDEASSSSRSGDSEGNEDEQEDEDEE